MTPHCYDQRPIREIKNDLMGSTSEEIDVVAALVVLCDRIEKLEDSIAATSEIINEWGSKYDPGGTWSKTRRCDHGES